MRINKPLILKPEAKIINRVQSHQTTPTLHISIEYYVLLPRRTSFQSRFNTIANNIFNVQRRTSELYLNKCGIFINQGINSGVGWLFCSENNIPCTPRLELKGNSEMASVIDNSHLKPPHKFFGRRVFTFIVVPESRFIDDPNLLGTTVTFGQPNNYSLYSFITLQALNPENPWIVAHEIGHALQNRVYDKFPAPNKIDPLNLMYEPVPRAQNPNKINITHTQTKGFRQSSLLYSTPITGGVQQTRRAFTNRLKDRKILRKPGRL